MRSNDEPADADSSQWTARFLLALGVVLAQILAAAAVFIIFLILAMNAASRQDDDWAGFGYLIIGLTAAPAVAAIVGPIAAARIRLPLCGLYCLPALAGVLAAAVIERYATSGSGPLGILIYFAGTASIAFATAHRPRRPKQGRAGHGGVPY
jgi:hypothetical protein